MLTISPFLFHDVVRCSYCRETLEEDKPEADEVDTRALVSR